MGESDMEVTVLDLASMEVMLLEAVMVLDVVCGRDLLMLMPGTAVDMEVMVDTAMVDTVARDPLMPGTDVERRLWWIPWWIWRLRWIRPWIRIRKVNSASCTTHYLLY